MNASGSSKTLLALDTSRVRVDPRLLSPLPAINDDAAYRVMVGGAATREEIGRIRKRDPKLTNEDAQTAYDTETKTWGLVVGSQAFSVKRPKNCARVSKQRDSTQP